jgi:SAM-dependent methyltransferase
MASRRRWARAQDFERAWWERVAKRIETGEMKEITYHAWKASEMGKRLEGFLTEEQKRSARVLEIGCGPVGIVSYLPWGERIAVDPLEDFYRSNPTLTKHRDGAVRYTKGTGEELPFPDRKFSLVILDNVLDHVQSAEGVLREVRRVLADDGLLYFAVNVRTLPGTVLHTVLAKLQIDKGHPYSFTARSIGRLLRRNGFEPMKEWISDAKEARQRDRKAPELKHKVKGYAGLYEFVYYAVCSQTKTRETAGQAQ